MELTPGIRVPYGTYIREGDTCTYHMRTASEVELETAYRTRWLDLCMLRALSNKFIANLIHVAYSYTSHSSFSVPETDLFMQSSLASLSTYE